MFGDVLCERPKPWFLCSSLCSSHYSSVAHRLHASDTSFPMKLVVRGLPANGLNYLFDRNLSPVGEGSWNVAWDMRPARWLHRPHTAWLLFSICAAYLAPPPVEVTEPVTNSVINDDDHSNSNGICDKSVLEKSANYKVTGVPADGRCLFRAIAHMVCLRNGEDAPDENRQKELADELRLQVVDELIKRRKEIEWFIEGDFDAYVKRIQKPFVWGGEPELLMASHVLKTTISVHMIERDSNSLSKIATYGEGYEQNESSSIKVLFHGYGHYDILEDMF
ncbi:OVARIAN TUMOR DOMAIN-containing deubiquitinating enzyme 3-like [Bidens hawaiensis]|uniref:OVARIAN TUMOR DOMAIN-containing deubiquitinating enzyme 3-like n=1 Tax=Bidens hawaiensis TaxID=980011 RepID=UPI00404B6284